MTRQKSQVGIIILSDGRTWQAGRAVKAWSRPHSTLLWWFVVGQLQPYLSNLVVVAVCPFQSEMFCGGRILEKMFYWSGVRKDLCSGKTLTGLCIKG